jgi:hypothetical protein
MPVGLQIKGSHGFTQIDSSYRNLVLVDQGSVTSSTGGSLVKAGRTTPILAIKPTFLGGGTKAAVISGLDITGSTYTWYVANGSCDYWLFDVAPVRAHGAGLRVFNPAGDVVFDSGYKPLRVIGVYDHTPQLGAADVDHSVGSLPAGKDIAFVQSRAAFYYEDQGGGVNGVGIEAMYQSGTTLLVRKSNFVTFSGSITSVRYSGQGIAVDVTGY